MDRKRKFDWFDSVTPFNPNSLSGQVLIWDVTNSAGRIIDGSNNVQQLTDLSGNGNNMVPGSAGVRPPFFSSGGGNNKPYLSNSTGSKQINITSLSGISTTPCTIYVVHRYNTVVDASVNTLRLVYTGASTSGAFFDHILNPTVPFQRFYNSTSSPFFGAASWTPMRTIWQLTTITLIDKDNMYIQTNDEPYLRWPVTRSQTPGTSFGITKFDFGGITALQMSEIRIFNRITTDVEHQNLKDYFISKYNIAKPTKQILFLGDSHTSGVMSGTSVNLGPYVQRVLNVKVPIALNQGLSGTVVDPGGYPQALGNNLIDVYSLFNKSKYSNVLVVFQYGTNDAAIHKGSTPTYANWKATYKSIIQSYITAGFPLANLYICTPPYSTGSYIKPGGDTTILPTFVSNIQAIASELGIGLIDFYAQMQTDGLDCATVVGGDGIHGDNAVHTSLYNKLVAVMGL